jgi:peptidyl-prolyl cis-trans isomerase C
VQPAKESNRILAVVFSDFPKGVFVMRHKNTLYLALLISLLLLSPSSLVYGKEKDAKDAKKDKAAIVNGTAITQSQLDTEIGRYERQISLTGRTVSPEQLEEMKKMVLQNLVNQELLTQESNKLGIKVSESEISDQMAALKQKFPSEKEFSETLGRLKLTEADLKDQLSRDMAIKKAIDQEVASKISISGDETKAFYDGHPDLFKTPEQVRASHILIKVDPNATAEEKAKAYGKIEEIQKKLKNGDDFAGLAKEYSECPSSANGGDLDYFERGQMVPSFDKAAFEQKKGVVGDIVETQFGYHLIKVTDRKEAGTMSYDEMKDKIAQHLKQEKVNQQMSQYIDQLKSKGKIEILSK